MKLKSVRTRIALASMFLLAVTIVAIALTSGASTVGARSGDFNANNPARVDYESSIAALGPQDPHPRPIPMGVSIGNTPSLPFIYAGTAGMRVRSLNNPDWKFILSNNHVLGAVGPDLCPNTATPGTWTLQPGTLDIGLDPGNDLSFIAGIFVASVPIEFSPFANNLVDAAISFTTEGLASTNILDIGSPNVGFEFPTPGMKVIKSGRTTGVTTGTVQSVNTTSLVNYGEGCGTARFVAQVIVTPGTFSAGGDSGAVILNEDTLNPVGLLFAGSETSTIMNHMLLVYLTLGVFVDGVSPTAVTQQELAQQIGAMSMDPQMARMRTIQTSNQDSILAIPGIVGIGIGLTEDGENSAFIVYTEKLTDEVAQAVPSTLEGIPVRLIESGEFTAR